MDNIEDKYNAAMAQIEELKLEVTRLRGLLGLQDDDSRTCTNEQMEPYSPSSAKESQEREITCFCEKCNSA